MEFSVLELPTTTASLCPSDSISNSIMGEESVDITGLETNLSKNLTWELPSTSTGHRWKDFFQSKREKRKPAIS